MLTEICAEIKNYFTQDEDKHIDDFEIIDGQITPSIDLLEGQYYRIVGSVFNDGVHQYSDENDILTDEPTFHGAVWAMRVPKDVIAVSQEIEAWIEKYGGIDSQANSPYQSESFGGYSYNKGSNSDGTTGGTWKNQAKFMTVLNHYRKLRAH